MGMIDLLLENESLIYLVGLLSMTAAAMTTDPDNPARVNALTIIVCYLGMLITVLFNIVYKGI